MRGVVHVSQTAVCNNKCSDFPPPAAIDDCSLEESSGSEYRGDRDGQREGLWAGELKRRMSIKFRRAVVVVVVRDVLWVRIGPLPPAHLLARSVCPVVV